MAALLASARCRCGSGRSYKRCCRPLHRGAAPHSPAALVRARFCAYALAEADYILETTHPAGPLWREDSERWRAEVQSFCRHTRFRKLQLSELPSPADEAPERARVELYAQLTREGEDVSFRERSEFRLHEGRWMYFGGEVREPG